MSNADFIYRAPAADREVRVSARPESKYSLIWDGYKIEIGSLEDAKTLTLFLFRALLERI